MTKSLSCVPWALLLTLSPCHLVTLSPAAAPQPDPGPRGPAFTLRTAAGVTAVGPLEDLGNDWAVRLGGEAGARAAAGDLVQLRQSGRALPPLPGEGVLFLANGDALATREVRLADEKVHFRADLGEAEPIRLPLEAVALVWLTTPAWSDSPDARRRELLSARRTRDTVLLRNGDTVEGLLAGLDDQSVRVQVDEKAVEVKRDRVAVIALSTELAAAARPKRPYARLVLANGSRLALASARCGDGTTLTGTTLFGATVRLPLKSVVSLAVQEGPAVYLTDLKPARYEHVPYLDLTWPYVADGSVTGGALCVGASVFDRGVGLHSASRLTYALDGKYRRFEALVGLDARTGRGGRVRLRVLADGKDLLNGPELTGRDEPLAVQVDVAGVRELTLAVEHGGGGPVQDHVNWADARLIKSPPR